MMKKTIKSGNVTPQAVEIEVAVLGALMLEKDALTDIIDIIKPDSFYVKGHQAIFEAILHLFNKNEPIDLLTVTHQLKKIGKLQSCGGAYYITGLTEKVSSGANIQTHARIIAENYIKRQTIELSQNILKLSFDEKIDAFDIIGELELGVTKINQGISSSNVFSAYSLIHPTIERINLASEKPNGITGIPSGWDSVDRVTGGWQKSDLIIVAARPSMGKTDFALNIAYNSAKSGVITVIFSLEMSKEQLMDRYFAISSEIDRSNIKNGRLEEEEWKKITSPNEEIANNFIIADESDLTPTAFRATCRRLASKIKAGMFIVDYLQLINNTSLKGNTNDRISDISRTLKLVAKELNVPVIALSQLSRNVENRGGDKRPQLSDLRDSGAIEQDADIVIFPFRPIKYHITERADGSDATQLMELDFAKNRSGLCTRVDLRYLGKYGKIVPFTSYYNSDEGLQGIQNNDSVLS